MDIPKHRGGNKRGGEENGGRERKKEGDTPKGWLTTPTFEILENTLLLVMAKERIRTLYTVCSQVTLNVLFTCWNEDAVASSQCTPRPRHLSYVGVLKHVDAIHVKFRATGTAERSLVTQ